MRVGTGEISDGRLDIVEVRYGWLNIVEASYE